MTSTTRFAPGIRVIAGASIGLAIGVAALEVVAGSPSAALSGVYAVAAVVFVAVGWLIVERRPGNAVGAIVLAFGVLFALYLPADAYTRHLADGPAASFAALYIGVLDLPAWMLIALVALLFPDGRLPSAAWRRLVAFELAVVGIGLIGAGLAPGPFPNTPAFDNPIGVPGFPGRLLLDLAYAGMLVAVTLSAGSLVVRWRRANAVERAQLKWVTAGALAFAVTAVATVAAYSAAGGITPIVGVVSTLGITLFPIAVGVAILRYRLYDIDRIISRSISWAMVTGLLVATSATAVLLLQAVLAGVTQGETLAVAASTLVAFALFQPLRRRVQALVDRRFDRVRADGERLAADFARVARDEVELEPLLGLVVRTAHNAVRPVGAGIWLRPRARVGP